LVRDSLAAKIKKEFPEADGIAGVATAGIPQGALVADALGLPFIYIRSAPKGHGMGNQIEGLLQPEKKYVVIEDLISTGGSSIAAVQALRAAGGHALCVLAVFDYGFSHAVEAFEAAGLPCLSIVGLKELLEKAVEINYIQPREMAVIQEWRKDPPAWTQKFVSAAQ
jgi:orotate phosphoribosyltransferase